MPADYALCGFIFFRLSVDDFLWLSGFEGASGGGSRVTQGPL